MNSPQFTAEQNKCLYCENAECQQGCPAGCSPRDFLKAAQLQNPQDFQRAAAEILKMNPLGAACGHVCPDKFCQKNCNRKSLDSHISIPCSQAFIVEKARELKREPVFKGLKSNGKRVAIIGSGPAGLAATALLSQQGYNIDIFEAQDRIGGQMALIPPHRLPQDVLAADIDFCMNKCHDASVEVKLIKQKACPVDLSGKYDHVVLATGQSVNRFPAEFTPIKEHILEPQQIFAKKADMKGKKVVVIGGGAVAVDVCATLKEQGAQAIVVYRRKINEMPVTKKELAELIDCAEIITKAVVKGAKQTENGLDVEIERVDITGRGKDMRQVSTNENLALHGVAGIVLASGFSPEQSQTQIEEVLKAHSNVVYCKPVGTVVEAVAVGKAAAKCVMQGTQHAVVEDGKTVELQGYDFEPADLKTSVFKTKTIPNPFVLSASPLTDGYLECKKALEAGWAGVILKTAFDGLPIHIPNQYMSRMGNECHANCDNVSGRSLDQVVADIGKLKQEFPDRLIAASTGGPVFGEEEHCRNGWQHNIAKLVKGGAELVELSLSCPQGGDSSEGSIAA